MKRFLFLVVMLSALGTNAQRVRLVVDNFGERQAPQALFDAMGLELELEEDILISSPETLNNILSEGIAKSDADTLREAMQVAEQDAILRAVFFEDDVDVALLVHRSSDGEIVYATRVDVDAAVTDARNVVVDKLLVALRGLEDRTRTPLARLEEIGVLEKPERKVVGGFFPEDGQGTVEKKKKKRKKKKRKRKRRRIDEEDEEEKKPSLFPEKQLRLSAAFAPQFLQYTLCNNQPGASAFSCGANPAIGLPLQAYRGAALSVDYRFADFLGLSANVNVHAVTITARQQFNDNGQITEVIDEKLAPNPFGGIGASGDAALTIHTHFGNKNVYRAGGRLGATFDINDIDRTTYPVQGQAQNVTLYPSSNYIGGLLGVDFGALVAGSTFVDVSLDALFGNYNESPDAAWQVSSLAFGARLSIDVDIPVGDLVLLNLGAKAFALSASGSGEGDRIDVGGTAFNDGSLSRFAFSPHLGVAWRY